MAREYETLEDLDTVVLGVSTDDLSEARVIAERLELPFPILYNTDADVVISYDVYNLLGDGVAAPSTFIIGKDGVIRWKYVGRSTDDRSDTSEIISELRSLESS